jgi:peptidoglycan-associated lipoprotein
MIRFFYLTVALALLGGCSSPMKLDPVPVEDRSTLSGKGSSGLGGNSTGVGQSSVTPVDIARTAPADAFAIEKRLVYFDFDSFIVRPEFQPLIEANARLILSAKTQRVVIEGHTDERGGREYNLALGQKRAESVRRALALQGVLESQMEAISYGKEKPAVTGLTEDAMEKNRRAEISYR